MTISDITCTVPFSLLALPLLLPLPLPLFSCAFHTLQLTRTSFLSLRHIKCPCHSDRRRARHRNHLGLPSHHAARLRASHLESRRLPSSPAQPVRQELKLAQLDEIEQAG